MNFKSSPTRIIKIIFCCKYHQIIRATFLLENNNKIFCNMTAFCQYMDEKSPFRFWKEVFLILKSYLLMFACSYKCPYEVSWQCFIVLELLASIKSTLGTRGFFKTHSSIYDGVLIIYRKAPLQMLDWILLILITSLGKQRLYKTVVVNLAETWP